MVRGRGYAELASRTSRRSCSRPTRAGRRCCCATWRRVALGPGDPARRRRPRRPGRHGRRDRGHAPRRERAATVIDRVQGERCEELEPSLPRGRASRHDLRPLRADPARDRHAAARADRWRSLIVQPGHPGLPLAHPVGDRADRHHPGRRCCSRSSRCSCMGITSNIMSLAGIAISIGVLVDGAIVEVENAYKKLELWERGGRQGRLPRGPAAGAAGGGAVGLLLAARDRGRLPADLHARRPGGAPLQAARLHEEPGDGDRRAAGDHARSGAAHALHADGLRPASGRAGSPGSSTTSTVGTLLPRGASTRSAAALFAVYEPACRAVLRHPQATIAAARCCSSPRRCPAYLAPRARVHAAAQRRRRSSTCRRRCPASRSPRRARLLQSQDRILAHVPRGGARASARRAAPRPRPIRRRSR